MKKAVMFPSIMFTKKKTLLTLSLALALLAASCSPVPETIQARPDSFPLPDEPVVQEADGRTGGRLRAALLGSPVTFNLAVAQDLRSIQIASLISATLLEFDRSTKTVNGGLTRSWKLSEDARSIELELRKGIRFSDGVEMTAADVVFTFAKIYEPESSTYLGSTLQIAGKPLTVSQLDDHRVKIESQEPYAGLEYILTTVPVFPRHRMNDPEKRLEDYWSLDVSPDEIAGLGPFVLKDHRSGQESVFGYNPHYWRVDQSGQRLPYLDELVVQYLEDRNTQLLRLRSGELDLLLDSVQPEDFLELQRSEDVAVFNTGASSQLTFCWFNLSSGLNEKTGQPYVAAGPRDWFQNLAFRRAIEAAVSRESLVENVFLGQAEPAFSLVPVSMPLWHADLPKTKHDPARARELLREAGFTWRAQTGGEVLIDPEGRPVEFSLLTLSQNLWGKIAAILQHDLEAIGIQLSIRQEEFLTAIDRITRTRDYEMAVLSLDFSADPVDHVAILRSSSQMHFWNPMQKQPATAWEGEIDRLMELVVTTLNLEQRQKLYTEVQRLLAENVPLIPLYNKDVLIAGRRNVRNLKPSNLSPHTLGNIWEIWIE